MLDRRFFSMLCVAILMASAPAVLAQSDQTGTRTQDQDAGQTPGTTTGYESGQLGDHSNLVRQASELFREANQQIPSSIMQNAQAIAVIPSSDHTGRTMDSPGMQRDSDTGGDLETTPGQGRTGTTAQPGQPGSEWGQDRTGTTGAMGHQQRQGLLVQRSSDGTWSQTPAFIKISSGQSGMGQKGMDHEGKDHTGTQMGRDTGVQPGSTDRQGQTQPGTSGMRHGAEMQGDLVLVFMSDQSLQPLHDGDATLGDIRVAEGPTTETGAGTTGTGTSGLGTATEAGGQNVVYAYSRSVDTFTGASVTGVTLSIDDSANQSAYGRQVTARELREGHTTLQAEARDLFQPLIDALRIAPARAE
jgi:lipid-binding SYLF domain-containing protein